MSNKKNQFSNLTQADAAVKHAHLSYQLTMYELKLDATPRHPALRRRLERIIAVLRRTIALLELVILPL